MAVAGKTHFRPTECFPFEIVGSRGDVELPPYLVDTPATRKWLARYYTEIERIDRLVGAVDELLHKHRLADHTLLLYSSDHGGQWPHAKWNLYDASVNVPFVAPWPGTIRAGSASDALIGFWDMVPTCIDLAGGEPVAGLDGESFAPVLVGQATEHHDAVFAASSRDGRMNDYPIRAATSSPSTAARAPAASTSTPTS